MKRCPQCHRFGLSYLPQINHLGCIWRDCNWINWNDIDVDKVVHPIKFWKFINEIRKKK